MYMHIMVVDKFCMHVAIQLALVLVVFIIKTCMVYVFCTYT